MIQDHFKGQYVILKVKMAKKIFFQQIQVGTSAMPLFDAILTDFDENSLCLVITPVLLFQHKSIFSRWPTSPKTRRLWSICMYRYIVFR